jgi:predicted transcriptional regulator
MNRGQIEIMAQVLAFCDQPRLKTQIMYNVNITFRQFETYALHLSSQELLTRNLDKFVTTEKGHKFIRAFNELQSTLGDIPLNALSVGPIPRVMLTVNSTRHTARSNASVSRR